MSGGTSRERVLGRVRRALADVPRHERPRDHPVPRDYRLTHGTRTPADAAALLAANLTDYRAVVHRTDEGGLPALVAGLLGRRGARRVVVPPGLPDAWLAPELLAAAGVEQVADSPALTTRALDGVDSVVTGCALAIAETGTIVLDAGPGQGRRALTLVPDHHVCVVRVADQVVDSVPRALARLAPDRPLTWISGPSATSDIELDRVEGVHGPRTLEVVLLDGTGPR
ncbi:LUD domain-containing protein [Streptomyces triculaminicus]|uniref:LUD domain-containing protein n=1 Tax=Streptomyces triculaminicus TaxID=2816232 RepID=A0A939FRS6_9ACTN|nr:LUD domain-containing protein [Streptomyces triculaminicus]MBO0656177.1 LUD domain-containing protein [Streptomyces triculaminicus]